MTAAGAAADDPWPSRPVGFIVPFAADETTTDCLPNVAMHCARSRALVVDAIAGGTTFSILVPAHAINPSLRTKLQNDTL